MQSEPLKCLKGKCKMHSDHVFKNTKWSKHLLLHLQTEHASLESENSPPWNETQQLSRGFIQRHAMWFQWKLDQEEHSVLKQTKTFPMYLDSWTLHHWYNLHGKIANNECEGAETTTPFNLRKIFFSVWKQVWKWSDTYTKLKKNHNKLSKLNSRSSFCCLVRLWLTCPKKWEQL